MVRGSLLLLSLSDQTLLPISLRRRGRNPVLEINLSPRVKAENLLYSTLQGSMLLALYITVRRYTARCYTARCYVARCYAESCDNYARAIFD